MAAISGITDGEILSSVRTKLNNVITEINLLDPTDWIDYSSTSTVIGWTTFVYKQIKYKIIGKQVFVRFNLEGTSNNTATTFTLPFNNISIINYANTYAGNNGVLVNGNSVININSNVFLGVQNGNTVWTASGSKWIAGQFFYEIA